MLTLSGKNGEAVIYTDKVDGKVLEQVMTMLNHPITQKTKMVMMPDVHVGKGSAIGTTIKLPKERNEWKISPNVVGVDIGCGMMSYKIKERNVSLKELDKVVNKVIPSGVSVHKKPLNSPLVTSLLDQLTYNIDVSGKRRIEQSLGTLGGGNHFIELSKDENKELWLTVHSGSRNLGVRTVEFHQNIAKLRELEGPSHLAYLEGLQLDNYIHDMSLTQKFAHLNRRYMLDLIVDQMNMTITDEFDSIHNFIDLKHGVIRKGATSAQKGERLIIPLNMRDGSLICIGKGQSSWNQSAPHGAGRVLSRSAARKKLNLDVYQAQMKGIYTTSVHLSTLDEAPDAYKPYNDIVKHIGDTAEVLHHIKPLYNFKAH